MSVHSSEQFSSAMIKGWNEVLMHKYPGTISAENICVKLTTVQEIEGKSIETVSDLGDLDCVVLFTHDLTMMDILPAKGHALKGIEYEFFSQGILL